MKSVTPALSNNPFEKDVVHEPRDHPPSVSSLNQETLDKLLSQFKSVESSGESPMDEPVAELIEQQLAWLLESGEVAAVNIATGKIEWTHKFPAPAFGATTVVNNLVFVSTFDGELYALNAGNGEVAWESELPAGSNAGVAVEGNTIIVGAGKAVSNGQQPALVAYRLGG